MRKERNKWDRGGRGWRRKKERERVLEEGGRYRGPN